MIVLRVVTLPVKVGTKTGVVATKVGYRTARLVGFKRLLLIAIGVGIGLLVAPMPGRQLRERLQALLAGDAALDETAPGLEPTLSTAAPVPAEVNKLVTSGTNGHA